MKFLLDNWMLITVALGSGGLLMWPVLQNASGGGLAPAAAVQLMNREKAVVVDVCEPDEFARGHLSGAKNLPLSQLEAKLPALVKNKALPEKFAPLVSESALMAATPASRRTPGRHSATAWPRRACPA